MDIIYEEVIPSPIENATTVKGIVDGVHRNYRISPNEGYVLHDKRDDFVEIDPDTEEEITRLAFFRGMCSCRFDYDFVANPYEFYTVPEDSVPADQIFGGGDNNDHEIM